MAGIVTALKGTNGQELNLGSKNDRPNIMLILPMRGLISPQEKVDETANAVLKNAAKKEEKPEENKSNLQVKTDTGEESPKKSSCEALPTRKATSDRFSFSNEHIAICVLGDVNRKVEVATKMQSILRRRGFQEYHPNVHLYDPSPKQSSKN